jgi:hypothetical protein
MELGAGSAVNPGHRIGGYRNSMPRFIKLLGLGDGGGQVARRVAKRGLSNVAVAIDVEPVGWSAVTAECPNSRANMVVIVCAEGDEGLFRPEAEKPDVLVTFVLLQRVADLAGVRGDGVAKARACSDLFVTTSDVDYVPDLIDNLAS